jgi:hypothetical protein
MGDYYFTYPSLEAKAKVVIAQVSCHAECLGNRNLLPAESSQ